MLTAIQEKWLQALESGNYKQARRRLKHLVDGELRYCCLGVACEILGLPQSEGADGVTLFNGMASCLPDNAVKELGVRGNHGKIGNTAEYLTEWNDDGKSFQEIAKFIRANPEKIFVNH